MCTQGKYLVEVLNESERMLPDQMAALKLLFDHGKNQFGTAADLKQMEDFTCWRDGQRVAVAVRYRSFEQWTEYWQRLRQVTIRVSTADSNDCEWRKFLAGCGDYLLWCRQSADRQHIDDWVLIDLHQLRCNVRRNIETDCSFPLRQKSWTVDRGPVVFQPVVVDSSLIVASRAAGGWHERIIRLTR